MEVGWYQNVDVQVRRHGLERDMSGEIKPRNKGASGNRGRENEKHVVSMCSIGLVV